MKKLLSSVAVMTLAFSTAGCAEAGDISKSQIEQIVKDYLLENPEIIREALIALDAKEERRESIRDMVEEAGADMAKFDADMKDVALDRQIEDTLALSNRIPQLTGTPFFVINDDYVSGANVQRLDDLLAEALSS